MMDEKDKGARQEVPRKAGSRQARLKLKLRENLKRRKVQERARTRMSDAPSAGDDTCPDGQVGKRGG
jgi:hypothetical protein